VAFRAGGNLAWLWLGGVAVGRGAGAGAGVYATLLRDAELPPLSYAPYLLVAGVVLVVAYLLLTQQQPAILRVGQLGVGEERDGKVTRYRWCQVEAVRLAGDAVRIATDEKPLLVGLRQQAAAARRLLEQAARRIPKRVELDDEERARVGEPQAGEGARVAAEPPQVTGMSCLASGEPLTFEKDVRMCRRCGALYHRRRVPRRCSACGKKLEAD